MPKEKNPQPRTSGSLEIRVNNRQKFRPYFTLQVYTENQLIIPVWEAVTAQLEKYDEISSSKTAGADS